MSDEFGSDVPFEVERDGKGRFRSSGNPKGRPVKIKRDPKLPASRRAAIFRIADREAPMNVRGKAEELTLFEANILQMAIAGAKGNRIAAKDFIQLTMLASNVDLQKRFDTRILLDRMEQVELENEELKRKYGPRTSGTVYASKEEWEAFERLRERRADDGIMGEVLDVAGEVRRARQEAADALEEPAGEELPDEQ